MTRPRREVPAGSAAPENPRNISPKTNRPPRSRRSRTDTRQNNPQAEPALTKYNELLQDIQDETSFFLPVDALSAGTHRYLYHLGDFSATNAAQMQRFLDDKREVLAKLEQGKLGNSEHRSALVLRPYMDSLSALIGAGYFGDTLWQLRNARRGLYQLLYMTEIPAYVRGKALARRLEELSTPPTAPAEQIQLRSGSHQELALEEFHIIDQYLHFAEDRASRFDDKQAIAERIVKARQYMSRLEPRLAHSTSTGDSTRDPVLSILLPSLDEARTREAQEHLERETETLKRQLSETAARLDVSRSTDEVVRDVLQASITRRLDQAAIDDWMNKDYPRLHSFFPGYRLKSVPVLGDELAPRPAYDDPEAVALKGASLNRRQTVCPIASSHRWLSPEIALMMTYFPGKAYIQTAISSWDPCLAFHVQRETFITALSLFELQNIANLDGMLTLQNSLLTTLQLLIEDTAAALDIEILQNRLTHHDARSFLQERVPLLPDLASSFSSIATFDFGISLARFMFRTRFREMRRISRTSNKKVSWASFYQSIFEQGTFDPAQLKNS
ncbi:MAG: hypothetical protein NTW63_06500 [Caldiserica bacterium]|nr:hypothetical protein [Caldisericota bacterium]